MKKMKFFHLRNRKEGVANANGGYTVAVKERTDGKLSVSICQCNNSQRYDKHLGERIAAQRLGRGQFFVQDQDELVKTLSVLNDKVGGQSFTVSLT